MMKRFDTDGDGTLSDSEKEAMKGAFSGGGGGGGQARGEGGGGSVRRSLQSQEECLDFGDLAMTAVDAATADDVRERQADQVELKHPGARKRARERTVEVID